MAPLEKRSGELTIFERNAARSERVLPAEEALERLPSCDVSIITSTALILGDLDGLLDAASTCREVALVGASTPLASTVFAPRGVTLLSGVIVKDAAGVLQIVSEAGGVISDWDGRALGLDSGPRVIAAGDPDCHRRALALLQDP